MKRYVPLVGMMVLAQLAQGADVSAAAPAKTGGGEIRQGITYYNKGYIQKAIPLFQRAADNSPSNEQAHLWLARALFKQGGNANVEAARQAYERVVSINPNNLEALLALGEILSWKPETQGRAIDMLIQANRVKPEDPKTLKKLVQILTWKGRYAEALEYAESAVAANRDDVEWMKLYAGLQLHAGKAEQAISIMEQNLNVYQAKDVDLLQDYASALYKVGRKDEAKQIYSAFKANVIKLPEGDQTVRAMRLAGLAFDVGEYEDALALDLALPPQMQQTTDVQIRIARSYAKNNRVPEAVETFQRLYVSGRLDPGQKLEFADFLRDLNLSSDALPTPNLIETLYQEAAEEVPNKGADVNLRLARLAAMDRGKFDDAVRYYTQALIQQGDPAVRKEFLDFLISAKDQGPAVEAAFQSLMEQFPGDVAVRSAYADFLSWQEPRRGEALKQYVELSRLDPTNRARWEEDIDRVLTWMPVNKNLVPVYEEVIRQYPTHRTAWLNLGRIYRDDKTHYKEAVQIYQALRARYPEDPLILKEWFGILTQDPKQRDESLALLEQTIQKYPQDLNVKVAYARVLSYDRKYSEAMANLNDVLSVDPKHRWAMIAKAYVLLWTGQKFKAREVLREARTVYPKDAEVILSLAEVEKDIGRYDKALDLLRELTPEDRAGARSYLRLPEEPEFILVDNRTEVNPYGRGLVYDYLIVPEEAPAPQPVSRQPIQEAPAPSVGVVEVAAPMAQQQSTPPVQLEAAAAPAAVTGQQDAELAKLQQEVEILTRSLEAINALQTQSSKQIGRMRATLGVMRDADATEMVMQAHEPLEDQPISLMAGHLQGAPQQQALADDDSPLATGLMKPVGQYAALDYDINPLLSGLGRFRNESLTSVYENITRDLRPVLRVGYDYRTQGDNPTTTKYNAWGIPNQLSLSLTPQLRVRAGFTPRRFSLPTDEVEPNDSWMMQYAFGATAKWWDHVTLEGDVGITNYSQINKTDVLYQAKMLIDFTDRIHLTLGGRRVPNDTSYLAFVGQRPDVGPFDGQRLGLVRENGVFAELSTNPFSRNIDWNLGYEFSWIRGEHVPNNTKNQAYTSLGYTAYYAENHRARLAYEFLWFGYGKNATSGFFNITNNSLNAPVVDLDPLARAPRGYVYGGYFSPDWFILNTLRLDLYGSFFNKALEYKLGGSLGIQAYEHGHGISDGDPTQLASSFDANLIWNWTDWFALYGNVDYLNVGGLFNRWRFGGGVVLRPHIPALSPVFGKQSLNAPASPPGG